MNSDDRRVVHQQLAESALDVEPVRDPHPAYDGERCAVCGADLYGAGSLEVECVPVVDREPFTFTTETTGFNPDPDFDPEDY